MKSSGITTVGEFHYFHHGLTENQRFKYDETILKAAETVNIRIVVLIAHYEHAGCEKQELSKIQKRFETKGFEEYLNNFKSLQNKTDGSPTQSVGVVAHSIRACQPETLKTLMDLSKSEKVAFHMHVEEQLAEIEQSKSAFGKTPLRCLLDNVDDQCDLSNFCLVHCTHTNLEDFTEYTKLGGNICVCPLTEGSLADGIPKFLDKTKVCVGTDSNLRIDFLEELRWLEYGQRWRTQKRGHFSVSDLVDVASVNGAKALNLETVVGKIEAGFQADFTVLNMDSAVFDNEPFLNGNEFLAAAFFGAGAREVAEGLE